MSAQLDDFVRLTAISEGESRHPPQLNKIVQDALVLHGEAIRAGHIGVEGDDLPCVMGFRQSGKSHALSAAPSPNKKRDGINVAVVPVPHFYN
ncbi:MAG: hypothetical protein ABL967_09120 [Bryobacteraceae bacterium]